MAQRRDDEVGEGCADLDELDERAGNGGDDVGHGRGEEGGDGLLEQLVGLLLQHRRLEHSVVGLDERQVGLGEVRALQQHIQSACVGVWLQRASRSMLTRGSAGGPGVWVCTMRWMTLTAHTLAPVEPFRHRSSTLVLAVTTLFHRCWSLVLALQSSSKVSIRVLGASCEGEKRVGAGGDLHMLEQEWVHTRERLEANLLQADVRLAEQVDSRPGRLDRDWFRGGGQSQRSASHSGSSELSRALTSRLLLGRQAWSAECDLYLLELQAGEERSVSLERGAMGRVTGTNSGGGILGALGCAEQLAKLVSWHGCRHGRLGLAGCQLMRSRTS